MKLLIILLIAFLALVYIYTFLKIRKRRKANASVVAEYHKKYLSNKDKKENASEPSDYNYKKYVTKYNSQIDYITKDELLSDK